MTESQQAAPLERARAFESAGDECVYDSRIEEAKIRYGGAIDAFLEARSYEEAIRICRKLIRLSPDVVRTRYTLLFLLIGLERYDEARSALEEYVQVVQASGTRSFAVPRLQLLSHVTEDAETSERIGSILSGMGAESLSYTDYTREPGEEPLSGADRVDRWETLLPIALRDVD